MSVVPSTAQPHAEVRLPRLGFVGVGWIGRNRMEAIARAGAGVVAAIVDADEAVAAEAAGAVDGAEVLPSLDDLLRADLDGIVIATPNALHAEQAVRALERGIAVFCQKPLARTAGETRMVVDAARAANRLLGVDMSYRATDAAQRMRALVRSGEVGEVYAADLVFHNAYGPAKTWCDDPALAGGGCVVDLGIHLVDLALWMLGPRAVRDVSGSVYRHGRRVDAGEAEDAAFAAVTLDGGVTVRIACSWHLPIGRDAQIDATFFGTRGAVAMRNVGGSFFDFVAERYDGRTTTILSEPPDDWGGRMAAAWARRLHVDASFDPEVCALIDVAEVVDAIVECRP